MHERTQRALARLTFVLCCAVPTLLTLLIIVAGKTSWYHRWCIDAVERELAKQTGLVVHVDEYQTVSPGHTLLKQIQLSDPETGATVATVRQVDWSRRQGRTHILLQQPELHARSLDQTWKLLHDRFLCRPEHLSQSVRIAATDLTIRSRHSPMTLRDVDAWIGPDPNSAGLLTTRRDHPGGSSRPSIRATIECLLAESGDSGQAGANLPASPIQLTLLRDRSGAAPTTQWSLTTGDAAVPCAAIAEVMPGPWSDLGSETMFSGTMAGVMATSDWQIDLSGATLSKLSLDRLFANQSHRFSGTATVKLERCRVRPSERLVDVSGSVLASDGLIGKSLLTAAANHLGFTLADLPPGEENILYDCLALRFSLLGPRLRLSGTCRHQNGQADLPVGVAMTVGGIPLAQTSPSDLASLRLLSALAPSHSEMVPLAMQNQGLLRLLLPPTRSMTGRQNQTRISGLQSYQGGPLTLQR